MRVRKYIVSLVCAFICLSNIFSIPVSAYTWRGNYCAEDADSSTYADWSDKDKDMLNTIVTTFSKAGWKKNAICGTIANLKCEGWNMYDEDRHGVYDGSQYSDVCGIMCWTEPTGSGNGARTAFLNWAKTEGKDWKDLATQCEYITECASCIQRTVKSGSINASPSDAQLKEFWDDISGVETIENVVDYGTFDFDTPEHAAEIWCWFFECPGVASSHINNRMRIAKDLAENAPISGGSGTSEDKLTDVDSIASNGFLNESAFVNIAVIYDTPVTLPKFEDLEVTDRNALREWTDDIENRDDDKRHRVLRVSLLFVGIMLVVYSTFLYVAYQFDLNQNFFEIQLLGVLTLGHLCVDPSMDKSTFSDKNKTGQRTVSHKDICIISLLGIAIGVLILSGRIFFIINAVISFVKEKVLS